jgi:pimeloyl-ACP methyl ester carboxylesterase
MRKRWRFVGAGMLFALAGVAVTQLPGIGAGALLHPGRRPVTSSAPAQCESATFAGAGVALAGWRCAAAAARRGSLVYLHGIADNRTSSAGAIERFRRLGLDVIAYDSRAHGESGGDFCTYGFYEKEDLRLVLGAIGEGPIVLFGTSLGAAVALQEASRNPRVTAVIAAETFADLQTVATERAPIFFTPGVIRNAFELAEAQGRFSIAAVSPVLAAASIRVPVLLVHGDADTDTPPEHSRRVFEALAGPRRLVLVAGAGHNQSLRGEIWGEVEQWVDAVLES